MFRLFGFPVHVRSGFIMFMVLIVVLYGGQNGLWLAGALALFTLIHELGHAVAARSTGAEAEISLSFFAGYASYRPTRPISRLERMGISFAGPAVQIATSVAVLLALGVNPTDRAAAADSPVTWAIWWAGPVIGLLNLIPILPLDGGNIVMTALDRLLPGKALRPMLFASLAATGVLGVMAFTNDRFRGFGIFVGFLLLTQVQMLGASRTPSSPWNDANEALHAGKTRKATRTLIAALSNPHHRSDMIPPALTDDEVEALVALLPEPLPSGDPLNEYVLANMLIRIGRFEDAAHYAADCYQRNPHPMMAAVVARAAGALGDDATAVGWLRAAAQSDTDRAGLAKIIDTSPELAALRQHPEVLNIRHGLIQPGLPAV
jgi:Zn-dependent protease